MEYLLDLVLLFFIYSFLGWCIEVTLKYFQYHRFINRGFFTGPVLPIYGTGAILITLAIKMLSGYETGIGIPFAVSFLLCGAIEYLASYFMEKRYHARWWDYSKKPMNLNGRIWIGNLVLFGAGGVLIIHAFNPVLLKCLGTLSILTREIIGGTLLSVFLADYVVTHFVLKLVKVGVESSEADNTEEINREIRLLLSDRSVFYRRFADAYPEVIYRTEKITARMAAIRAESERIRREAQERIDAKREEVARAMEPSVSIRNTVIRNQNALINMLYDENEANDDMRALKKGIDQDVARLRERHAIHL